MKKNKRKLKVFLCILLAFIIVIAGIVIWQWNNVVSVVYFLKYSENDLDKLDKENKQQLSDAMKKLQIEELRELTEEETKAYENGEITQEDAINISLGRTTLEDVSGQNNNVENQTEQQKVKTNSSDAYLVFANSSESDYEWRYNWKINSHNYQEEENSSSSLVLNTDNKVAEQAVMNRNNVEQEEAKSNETDDSKVADLIAELYVLKSSYLSKLSGLEAKGKSEYSATPSKERTSSWKAAMISKYTGLIAAWEAECDARVEGIISKIKAELKRTGGDMSVIDTIRSTYSREKQLKKAGYMNAYLN